MRVFQYLVVVYLRWLPTTLRATSNIGWGNAWTRWHDVDGPSPPPSTGWYVGQPMGHPERNEWAMFAFDTTETPVEGQRSREWTALGQAGLQLVQTMA